MRSHLPNMTTVNLKIVYCEMVCYTCNEQTNYCVCRDFDSNGCTEREGCFSFSYCTNCKKCACQSYKSWASGHVCYVVEKPANTTVTSVTTSTTSKK